jgi:hypothetical protein
MPAAKTNANQSKMVKSLRLFGDCVRRTAFVGEARSRLAANQFVVEDIQLLSPCNNAAQLRK